MVFSTQLFYLVDMRRRRRLKPQQKKRQKAQSDDRQPVILPRKQNTGGITEENQSVQMLSESTQTKRDASEKKGEINISYSNVSGPVRESSIGYLYWLVKFETNGKDGWIVQKMENTSEEYMADGSEATDAKKPTAKYYEAWKVGSDSSISPSGRGGHDLWERGYISPMYAKGRKGSWSIKGTAYFTQKDISKKGFAKNSVPDAKSLMAKTGNPGKLGKPLLVREQKMTWDGTNL